MDKTEIKKFTRFLKEIGAFKSYFRNVTRQSYKAFLNSVPYAGVISCGFSWYDTAQGFEYWFFAEQLFKLKQKIDFEVLNELAALDKSKKV